MRKMTQCSDTDLRQLWRQEVMSVQQAADYLGCSASTIRRHVRLGDITAMGRGGVRRHDIQRIAENPPRQW